MMWWCMSSPPEGDRLAIFGQMIAANYNKCRLTSATALLYTLHCTTVISRCLCWLLANNDFPVHLAGEDSTHKSAQAIEARQANLVRVQLNEVMKECTFHPKTSEKQRQRIVKKLLQPWDHHYGQSTRSWYILFCCHSTANRHRTDFAWLGGFQVMGV